MPGRSQSKKVIKGLRCTAKLKDGSPCKTWQAQDGLCPFHWNAAHPEPTTTAEETVEHADLELSPDAQKALGLAPSGIRAKLAQDLAGGYPALVSSLRDAMSAEAVSWVQCKRCGVHNEVPGADHKTRLAASKLWVELGLGTKREEPEEKVDLSDIDIDKMSKTERREMMTAIVRRFPEIGKRHSLLALLQKNPD